MEKKKILYIVESFGSGVFTFLVDLINTLDDEYEIVVAYGERKETLKNFKDYFSANVRFIKVENFTRSINIKKDLKALKEVKKIIKDEKPDIIHLHSSKAGVIGRLAISGRKVKMFYNPHGFSFLKLDDSKLKRVIYWLIEKIITIINPKCIIIGCSQGEYEEARKLSKKSICINNGINIEKLNDETKELNERVIDFKKIKICTSGRIGNQKNPVMFNEIAKKFPNIEFTWIGDGMQKNKLTSPNINITGWKSRKEVLRILNDNDIFILTSLWEGLPISLLEAMYMKKVCIVSNVIGNRDVIQDGVNGYIANNIDDFSKIINDIMSSRDVENIKENAKLDVTNEFNTVDMIEKYKREYENE